MDLQPNSTYNSFENDPTYNEKLFEQNSHKLVDVHVHYGDKIQRKLQCYVTVDTYSNTFDILELIRMLDDRKIVKNDDKIFYKDYSQQINQFIGVWPINKQIRIKFDSLINRKVEIVCQSPSVNSPAKKNICNSQKKGRTIKQRSIGEAVEAVRNWRNLYDTPDYYGKKRLYTLDQAAQKVGIPKKSLDDYYNHIQVATQNNFNFERYKEQKMGLLRKFVKAVKSEGTQFIKSNYSQYILEQDFQKYWATDSAML